MTMLSPDPASLDDAGGVVQYAPFVPCTHAPQSGCNATQYSQWQGLGAQILSHLMAAVAASPIAEQHGGFLTSCPTHGTAVFNRSNTVRLRGVPDGLTAMEALRAWYAATEGGEGAPAAALPRFSFDAPWPPASAWPAIVEPNALCAAPWR
jgi:hypothetical protein